MNKGYIFRDYIIGKFPNRNSYQPDFIFQDPNTNLHVDIEIDEPYSFFNGQLNPIHYINNENLMHSDETRDSIFNQYGWIVIRFAEEQVVNYPKECCKKIAEVIYEWTNQNVDRIPSINQTLKEIFCWSETEARFMAYNKSRKFYLTEEICKHPYYKDINEPLLREKIEVIKVDEELFDDKKYNDDLPF